MLGLSNIMEPPMCCVYACLLVEACASWLQPLATIAYCVFG